jgi:hypothetical protein
MSNFGSIKTCAMTILIAGTIAFGLADKASACGNSGFDNRCAGGFGGCDRLGGLFCENNVPIRNPRFFRYEVVSVEAPVVVYAPRVYVRRRHRIAHHHHVLRPVVRDSCFCH